ncbi:MAG TPA: DUF1844 domain-containing protein [Planctomicrobium sp.]|nr:DUF1844 domain-containing protein [Planctomicrobium sp.]
MSDSTSPGDKPQIEIAADEDWKSRVKAEDAELDSESQPQSAEAIPASSDEPPDEEPPLPNASFLALLQMLSTQAILAMGLIPGPDGSLNVELSVARHFIDLLGILETKTKGNLTPAESQIVEQNLHELRMAFIEVSRKSGS